MATNDTHSDTASPPTTDDNDDLPATVEYPGDADEQAIKLDLADRVSDADAVTGIEELSIDEQDDGTQIATVTWDTPDDATENSTDTDTDAEAATDNAGYDSESESKSERENERENESQIGHESSSETEADPESDDEAMETDRADADADAEATDGDADADPIEPDEGEGEAEAELVSEADAETKSDQAQPATDEPDEELSPPTTFEAVIEVGTLREALAPVDALVEECRVHLDHDGLRIRAVDAANVAMTDLQVGPEAFDAYEADPGRIGLDLDRFLDAIGMGDKDDLVQLTFDPEMRKLVIAIDNLEVTMALIDPETIRAEPDIPNLNLPAHLTCQTGDLDRVVTATGMVADHLRLAVDPEAELFVAEAQGDTDSVRVERNADDLDAFSPGDADSLFSHDYLDDIVGAIPRDTPVSLDLGDEFPVMLTYSFVDGHGDVNCMLAPRIQNE